MQNQQLKVQHIIVLTALFVSLFASLLILDKMDQQAIPLTGATTIGEQQVPEETVIRVVEVPEEEQEDETFKVIHK